LGLKKPPIFFSTLEVPIRYKVLNGKEFTNVDGSIGLILSIHKQIKNLILSIYYSYPEAEQAFFHCV